MAESGRQLDKWLFIAGLSLLGFVLAYQLLIEPAPDNSSPPEPFAAPRPVFDFSTVSGERYSVANLRYFSEIAFQSEHIKLQPLIRKWQNNIVIRIEGNPTGEDLKSLKRAIDSLNSLQDQIELSVGFFDASVVMHFRPESEFKKIHGGYIRGNRGFFVVRWMDEVIYHATILIDSETTSQPVRDALILEELTQSLGLMNVSSRYDDSLFNDDEEVTNHELSKEDRKLVEMLYQEDIRPGMTPVQALNLLAGNPPVEAAP